MTDLNSGSSPNIIRDQNIGAIMAVFLNGVVNGVNDHVQSARRMDKTGILQNVEAVGNSVAPTDQSVYVRTTRSTGGIVENIAVLRISDHGPGQGNRNAETPVLYVNDVIAWSLPGVGECQWSVVTNKLARLKHVLDPDVIFILDMDAAESKINQGIDMAIDMINAYFKKNGIGINL